MNQKLPTREKSGTISVSRELINAVLKELRLLRVEVNLLLPREDIKDYAHAGRVKRSYKKAVKQYPPLL